MSCSCYTLRSTHLGLTTSCPDTSAVSEGLLFSLFSLVFSILSHSHTIEGVQDKPLYRYFESKASEYPKSLICLEAELPSQLHCHNPPVPKELPFDPNRHCHRTVTSLICSPKVPLTFLKSHLLLHKCPFSLSSKNSFVLPEVSHCPSPLLIKKA